MWLDNLIPDSFFISGFALIFLLLIYLPLIIWLVIKLWRAVPYRKGLRLGVILLFILVAAAIPLGDVYVGSLKLERLCEVEGGTHIYKTVKADGFYSDQLLYDNLLKYGYSYVEGKSRGRLYVAKMVNGEIVKEEISEPQSRHLLTKQRQVLNQSLSKTRYIISDRKSGDMLAERSSYGYYGGWLDRNFFLSWIDYKPMTCKIPRYETREFVTKILIPSNSQSKGDAS